MKTARIILGAALVISLVSVSLVFGQSGNTPDFLGGFSGLTEIRGKILCSACTVDEAKQRTGKTLDVYLLKRGREQAVMHVTGVRSSATGREGVIGGRWDAIVGLTNELKVRAEEQLWRQLIAEENLRKTITIKGALHSTQTFDITEVSVDG
ncbi:MAG: hypothetical protein AB7P69_21605 [Candidatus Binatia bacterium]